MESGGGCLLSVVEGLGTVQRILVTTDGTITRILEACTREPVHVVKLSHSLLQNADERRRLDLEQDERALRRKVLLRGRRTGTTFMYAESVIALDRVPPVVVNGLLDTDLPIGTLLTSSLVETAREILICEEGRDGGVAAHLGIPSTDMIVSRTYRILTGGRPLAWITEKFAKANFLIELPLVVAAGQVGEAVAPVGGPA